MNIQRYSVFLTLTAGLLLMLCAPLSQADISCQGIGGTGHGNGNCGIGGTGLAQDGIGGTGHGSDGIGGTGIVGTITGFGSVWVNGLEVHYDAQTQGETGNLKTQQLAIGQLVVINAHAQSGHLRAAQISVVNTVVGVVESVNEQMLIVLGQVVRLDRHTIHTGSMPQVGDSLKISGLRLPNGEIIASYVTRSELSSSSVVGPITALNGQQAEIYGLKIQLPNAGNWRVGQEISVRGEMQHGALKAQAVEFSAESRVLSQAQLFELQGYVGHSAPGEIRVGGIELKTATNAAEWQSGQLVHVSGHLNHEHQLMADRIEVNHDWAERSAAEIHRGNLTEHGGQAEHVKHENTDRLEHLELERPEQADHNDHSQSEQHANHHRN